MTDNVSPVKGTGAPMTQDEGDKPVIALLCMAYGTPRSMDELEAFYTHIRGGRRPSDELLAELRERYEAIGGSPLAEITQAQAEGVARRLNEMDLPCRFQAFVGMKHAAPFIREAVESIAAAGIYRAVGLTLTPQYSKLSVGAYIDAARSAAESVAPDLRLSFIESWHRFPEFVDVLARRLKGVPNEAHVIFTAHSLPERILQWNDAYPRHLRETAEAVAERAGIRHWSCAYQSAGRTAEPWLGPDLLEELEALAKQGRRQVWVCPAGFVADHLEVLYDIDIEAQQKAAELGVELRRTESLNASGDFVAALASVVAEHLRETGLGEDTVS